MSKENELTRSQQQKPVETSETRVPLKSSASGRHKLALNEVLKSPANQAVIQNTRKDESMRPLRAVSPLPPAPPMPGAGEAKKSRESLSGLEKEAVDATVTLVDSVDSITEAMLLVIGTLQEVVKTQTDNVKSGLHTAKWVRASGAALVLCIAMLGGVTYLLVKTVVLLNTANEKIAASEQGISDAAVQLTKLRGEVEVTKAKVEEVKEAAAEAPKVELFQDEKNPSKGVVRFSAPPSAPMPAAAQQLEIQVDLTEAKMKDPQTR